MYTEQGKPQKLGIIASGQLAFKIVLGSLRLLARYPKLVIPLVPIFILVLLISISIPYADTLFMVILGAIFAAAVCLMISFGFTNQMLRQIHDGREPSLRESILSRDMTRMVPRIVGLSTIWFSVVLILVIIEMIINAILDRISRGLGDSVVDAIFGTVADALRMSAFMMVAIMVFEDVGLRLAFRRLREIVKQKAIAFLGGLFLTRFASTLVALILFAAYQFLDNFAPGTLSFVLIVPFVAVVWIMSIYLEQLFVAGLYLYSMLPDSPVVQFLLQDIMDQELHEPSLAN